MPDLASATLRHSAPNPVALAAFVEQLVTHGFSGDIARDEASRLVVATDNSIYQVLPAAVLFPRDCRDIALAVRLAGSNSHGPIPISPRGGGTGTNGQSLTPGVVLDVSRYMNRILELDVAAGVVTVQPGVVLGQLNAYLSEFGLFFPVSVSSGTRATIGGMVATDASGKGSRIYGPTSNYIEALDIILSDGSDFRAETMSAADFDRCCRQDGVAGRAAKEVRRVMRENKEEIERVFPVMNRHLTGYNLQKVQTESGAFALQRMLAGSEGTLGIVHSIRLRVVSKPRRRALAVVRYRNANAALEDVSRLLGAAPLAIEFVDERVVALARGTAVGAGLGAILGDDTSVIGGMNFIEFVGEDEPGIGSQLVAFEALLNAKSLPAVVDWKLVSDEKTVDQLWRLRDSAVGLLGKSTDARQGTAFVEDCAVPPERLPSFIREFRAVLDRYGLEYGLYGHADVGCLHVRPLLDMREHSHAALIRPITNEVDALVRRHGGLLWGEHGRGYRGEFLKNIFGPKLYGEICRIKAAFDPNNIFNPGKIAVAGVGAPLHAIDAIPFRGAFDAKVSDANADGFERALACNGNGVCFSWDSVEVICPSYKATGDRTQSPKGRAVLLREWARRKTVQAGGEDLYQIEEALHHSLRTCLSCKACATQCPVQVDIPAMRSRFLHSYYDRRRRPLRDHLAANVEWLLLLGMRLPLAANRFMGLKPVKTILSKIGFIDLPTLSPQSLQARFQCKPKLDLATLSSLSDEVKSRTIIFVPDTFTTAFDTSVPLAAARSLERLGYTVHIAPLSVNGKALHVLGFGDRFARVAQKQRARHAQYAATGCHVVGVEAVAVLMDRSEYLQGPADGKASPVRTFDEFLMSEIEKGRLRPERCNGSEVAFGLFLHCTEKTAMPDTHSRWEAIFSAFGLKLEFQRTGCCGMAGLFGHEREHQQISRTLFDLSWRKPISKFERDRILATGFSCRCQVKRMIGVRPSHPIEVLDQQLAAA